MQHPVHALIAARQSVTRYEPGQALDDASIVELVRLATLAPSAYNFQNWHFIAVRTPAAKARLQAAAFGQPQVGDAAVTFIISGLLAAHEGLPRALRPAVGIVGDAVFQSWLAAATQAHARDPRLQRDEAIRSASLAAMTLMLAAQGMGLASGAMGGFDAQAVVREFGLDARTLPVMLVTVGRARADNWPQKPRLPVSEVLVFA